MRREENVPVKEAKEAFGSEEGGHSQKAFPGGGLSDLKLEPSPAWHFHLGAEAQQLIGLNSLNAPKVDRIGVVGPRGAGPSGVPWMLCGKVAYTQNHVFGGYLLS
jgi:hypothetical protein